MDSNTNQKSHLTLYRFHKCYHGNPPWRTSLLQSLFPVPDPPPAQIGANSPYCPYGVPTEQTRRGQPHRIPVVRGYRIPFTSDIKDYKLSAAPLNSHSQVLSITSIHSEVLSCECALAFQFAS